MSEIQKRYQVKLPVDAEGVYRLTQGTKFATLCAQRWISVQDGLITYAAVNMAEVAADFPDALEIREMKRSGLKPEGYISAEEAVRMSTCPKCGTLMVGTLEGGIQWDCEHCDFHHSGPLADLDREANHE